MLSGMRCWPGCACVRVEKSRDREEESLSTSAEIAREIESGRVEGDRRA